MREITTILTALRRPRILIRAARAGLTEYQRDRDLRRILRGPKAERAPQQAILTLLAEERRLETNRCAGEATYSIQRHVSVLTALLAEARLQPGFVTPGASAPRCEPEMFALAA